MDEGTISYIVKVAVFTVGVTSMLKQVLPFIKSNRIKVFLTFITGACGGVLLYLLPEQVFLTIIGISVAVVFYDSVLKMIERVLKGSLQ